MVLILTLFRLCRFVLVLAEHVFETDWIECMEFIVPIICVCCAGCA
jgi:hypothetical protein